MALTEPALATVPLAPTPPAPLATPAVAIDGVTASYGRQLALTEVTVRIEAGTLLAIVGPNGAGKSTLLKLIAGLIKPSSGTLEVLGGPPGAMAKRVAYLPQAEAVDWDFPVTVHDVVMMGRYARLGLWHGPGEHDRDRVAAALDQVGMAHAMDRQIGALSGGQRRRVFLARALAGEPDLYLLDEPVTGVDAGTQADLMDVLAAEARAGKTIIATTHDLIAAAGRFHQAALLSGRLIAHGDARLVLDRELLARTYGGDVLVLPAGSDPMLLDDAHHHDDAPGADRHYHDGSR